MGPLSCHAGTVMIATLPPVAKIDVSEEECVMSFTYSHVLPQHYTDFLVRPKHVTATCTYVCTKLKTE